MNKEELQPAVNDSGFPLQLGLKLLANTVDWQVLLSEHPWRDPATDGEKFIDLVINGRRPHSGGAGFQTLVIECKRAREADWIFLRESNDGQRVVTRARVVARRAGIPQPLINEWTDVQCIPGSPIGEYCVIRKARNNSQVDLLERTSAEIVRATDALADEELSLCMKHGLPLHRVYMPLIVTTAKLYMCDADYLELDLDTGEVDDIQPVRVPFLRFTKSLGVGTIPRKATSLADISSQSERSVIVVQAGSFIDFLDKWDLGNITTELKDALFN